MKTFQELQIGDYFRIPGISAERVYRKASHSHCSLHAGLQPIRSGTVTIPLSATEIAAHFVENQEFLKNL